ncbi:MAG TPA: LPXTG cell wall anchor domain-containing protein [Bryobacteraceae bacterium]|jgi:LPXTG-motif cell wall-anchored protein
MMFRACATSALFLSLFAPLASYAAIDNTQNIAIDSALQIPGTILNSGTYKLALESWTAGRAVVRISSANTEKQYLLLAVPNRKLGVDASKGIVLFTPADGRKQILRGWVCPVCSKELEFVYLKAEAANITDETGQPVFAVDPAYDKLPHALSVSDMKVATIWSFSPQRIVGANRGVGVKAVKYLKANEEKAAASQKTAEARLKHLPKTATNTWSLALWGAVLLAAGLALRVNRLSRS